MSMPIASRDLPLEQEVLSEELTESLHPEGHFDPEKWLYEQLCLALPHRKLCRQDCGGIDVESANPPHPRSPLGRLARSQRKTPT